jgi:hypothetical protein
MTAVGFQMKTREIPDMRQVGARQGEWSGAGWIDSSWELAHGLEVVEDLPPDAWPKDAAAAQSPVA